MPDAYGKFSLSCSLGIPWAILIHMYLRRISLSDYRNFTDLDLSLSIGPSLFVGRNAQGKTNLLESVSLIATARAPRAEMEWQLISWAAAEEMSPVARVVGEIETKEGGLKVEVIISGRHRDDHSMSATKVVRVNGLARRSTDAMGQFNAVLFEANDLSLVTGPPGLRRRYLDITLSQGDRAYRLARQRYEKVLTQRNHLLKRVREGLANRGELEYWNEALVSNGAILFAMRAGLVERLDSLVGDVTGTLLCGDTLHIGYEPRIGSVLVQEEMTVDRLRDAFTISLGSSLEQDVRAGMTLLGPHRDDLGFRLSGHPAVLASRAQQRSVALALRLAEARFLKERKGETPVLLLDDVMSEMDRERRSTLEEAVRDYDQVLITAVEVDHLPSSLVSSTTVLMVTGGRIAPAPGDILVSSDRSP